MRKAFSKEILWKIIERSKKEPELAPQAATAITKLNEMGEDFSGKDLSGVNIPGADLKNAEMEGVNFTGANLRGVRFTQTNLRKAIVCNAEVHGLKFMESIELAGHTNAVSHIEFSPNSALVATVAISENFVKLWEVSTGELLRTFEGHTATINSIEFSSDNLKMVTSSNDHTAILWEVETGDALQKFKGHTDSVRAAIFISNDRIATGGFDKNVCYWSQSTGILLKSVKYATRITCLACDPERKILSIGFKNNGIRCWNMAMTNNLAVLTQSFERLKKIKFTIDGSKLIAWDNAGKINIWNTDSFTLIEQVRPASEPAHLVTVGLVNDSKGILAHTIQQQFTVRDFYKPKNRSMSIAKDDGTFTCLSFSNDANVLAVGDQTGRFRLWNVGGLELNNPKRACAVVAEADFKDAVGLNEQLIKAFKQTTATNYSLTKGDDRVPWLYEYAGMPDKAFEKWVRTEEVKTRVDKIITGIMAKIKTFAKYLSNINYEERKEAVDQWVQDAENILIKMLPNSDFMKLSLKDPLQVKSDHELIHIVVDELKSIFLIEETAILEQQLIGAVELAVANINILLSQEKQSQEQIEELGKKLTQVLQSEQRNGVSDHENQGKTFSGKAKGALGDLALSAGKGAVKEVGGEVAGKVTDEVLSSDTAKSLGGKISGFFKG